MSGARTLQGGLRRTVRRLRVLGALAVGAVVLAVGPAVLLVAWAVGGSWGLRGAGPLVLVVTGAAVAVVLTVVLTRRWVAPVDDDAVAAATERAEGLPEGSLRGVLELGRAFPTGVSEALFRRSESELSGWLSGASPRRLAGDLGRRIRRRSGGAMAGAGALALLAILSGFITPDRARAGWTPLLRPVAHLGGGGLGHLEVRPGDAEVDRGEALVVAIRAGARREVALHWRAVGDVPQRRAIPLEAGQGTGRLGPIVAPLDYWVTAPDGAVSDTFRVLPRDPLLVTSLTAEVVYPPHVGRAPDRLDGDLPPLTVPEGTVLRISGRTTRPLARAVLRRGDGSERVLDADGAVFRTEWRLGAGAAGVWRWELRDTMGAAGAAPEPLTLDVVADGPPQVRITVPGVDTLMPGSLRQAVVADAGDDHGIASASLVFRRVSAGGAGGAPSEVPLPVRRGEARVLLRGVVDASELQLSAGDAVEYHVAVRDNSPAGQVGRSAAYRLRVPGMTELREQVRESAEGALEQTRSLAEEAGELETATRNLSRRATSRGRSGSPGGGSGAARERPLEFGAAAEAREVADRQAELLGRADALRDRIEELRRAVEKAGLRDPALERRLDELRELYAELATPEVRQELERLRGAVEELDPEAVQAALERLAEQQEALRDQAERSLELMRRVAAEQELASLAREAEEIAGRQAALAEAMAEEMAGQEGEAADTEHAERPGESTGDRPRGAGADSTAPRSPRLPDDAAAGAEREDSTATPGLTPPSPASPPSPEVRAGQQEDLEGRAAQLNQALRSLQQRLMQVGEQQSASAAGAAREQGESARASMQQAADEARQQQGGQASQSGRRAAAGMAEAASTLDAARRQMGEARREESARAMQQATREALELAQRQESLRREMAQSRPQGAAGGRDPGEVRSEQVALQEGLEQLERTLSESAERSGRLDPAIRQALERARLNMQRTLDGLEQGERRMPVREAEQSVESLNQLAMELLNGEARSTHTSPSGLQQALDRLAELAREQGALNGQLAGLTPLQLGKRALRQQMGQAAERQRGIGRRAGELSRMTGGRDDVLGQVDQLSAEAEQIARELEGGRLDPEIRARQERLFDRLLDAGRSLEREEYSDERVSRGGGSVEGEPPAALDPALLERWLRYPSPSGDQLRALAPAYRRLILEYFDRLNRGAAEGGENLAPPGAAEPEGGRS